MKCFVPAVLAAAGLASAASAHPRPRAASPAPNGVLAASPQAIRITFSEGLIGAFSGIELRNVSGKAVTLGPSAVDRKDSKTMSAPVRGRLAPGTYTVSWHVVGDDTHHVAGHYSFQVKP